MRAAVFFVMFLTACGGYDDLALLEVDTIVPPEIEPGGTLRIHGRGFPLGRSPDIVLLDNMSDAELREAVARRDKLASVTELEASGGVNLDTVASIAQTGVERISVGALTHSAVGLDLGLDWR